MATNKHALIRYRILDRCFANVHRPFFIEDLIEQCSRELSDYEGKEVMVSRRQIFNDMAYMSSESGYKAIIDKRREGKRVYYRYQSTDFSIQKQPLNASELEQVKLALDTFGRMKGMPQFNWLNSIQAKIRSGLSLDQQEQPVIMMDDNELLHGLEHLEPLYRAILAQQVLLVDYQSFKQEQGVKIIFHPYILKEYNNRWFILGKNAEFDGLQNLAIDRIQSFTTTNDPQISYIPSDIDFKDYFKYRIGVTRLNDVQVEHIVLKFAPSRLPYVLSKPIHFSQKDIGDQQISLTLSINPELESLLLSYGKDVEIIKPVFLRDRISAILGEAFQHYQ